MPHVFLSAAHKSSGKTTISLGLIELFRRAGLSVAPCKKGPDYIDPIWLSIAARHACKNLDTFICSEEEVIEDFNEASKNSDITIIEGNKGLYDGVALDGSNSNAAVAKLLKAPVILVIDCRGITRGIAPLLLGYQIFDREVQIKGVILNRVGGERHESKLRASVEHFTDIPVMGAVHECAELNIDQQHLGLVPGNEVSQAVDKIYTIANHLQDSIDLQRIIDTANAAEFTESAFKIAQHTQPSTEFNGLRIGIATDKAFGFYYPDDLRVFKEYGASLINFNTLEDRRLPENLDALFIGGGFPERHAQALSDNSTLRHEIHEKIESGLPAYAECGGLMYLSASIVWQNKQHEMVGIINSTCTMHEKPKGRGYVKLERTDQQLWPNTAKAFKTIHAHEFHYSHIDNLPENSRFTYRLSRGTGIDGEHDGLIYNNLLASYTHMRHTKANPWVLNFLRFIAQQKQNLNLSSRD